MIERGGGGGGSRVADRDRRSSGWNCGEDSGGGMEVVEEQGVVVMEEKDFWFEKEQENSTLLDMNDASVLFGDFPSPLALPCMSSSSSSSSSTAPAAAQTIAATPSSSSAASSSPEASWAVPKRKRSQTEAGYAVVSSSTTATDVAATPSDLEGTLDADCVHMMENLGYMDLIDSNELWDPSSLFESQEAIPGQEPPPHKAQCQEENDGFSFLRGNKELSMIFLDWLKQNKDHISAEDVRKIKLNRSTIENASKRLGRTKEGMKRLLKLILEWVEQHQLQKNGGRRPQSHCQYQENPGVNPTLVPNSSFSYINVVSPDNSNQRCFPTASCMIPVPTPQVLESATLVAATPGLPPPAVGYCNMGGATYSNPQLPVPPAYHHHQQVMNMMPCAAPSSENQMMNNAQAWTPAPYTVSMSPQFSHSRGNGHPVSSYQQLFVGNPYQVSAPNGENLVRSGCSATREARKNRMARQKLLYSNHHRHKNQIDCSHPIGDPVSSPEDWVYSPVTDSASTPPTDSVPTLPVDASQPSEDQVKQGSMQLQDFRPESYSDQRQNGCLKTERNLKFLMQKVLKQSDVGNLGRIVLPKKEAENHLPELGTRDGVTIAMEDIGASRVWNMRYRFWPNNKSRMYLLENTGDFVKVNGLQEGDFIVIYLDTKCGKYMIRGVKVRPPEAKPEKPTGRRNARNLSRPHISSSPGPAVT